MKTLLHYLKQYKKESLLGPLFKLLEASFELMVPLVMAAIIDRGIAAGDTKMILCRGGMLVGLALIGLACSLTAQYYAAKAAVGVCSRLRQDLFAHIQQLSYTQLDTLGTSSLITRMTSDINQVQSGVNLILRLFLRSPFVVFGAMVMAFSINHRISLLFLLTILLLSIVVFFIMLWGIPRYQKIQGQLDGLLHLTRENLSGVRVIRAFHREAAEQCQFTQENQALTAFQQAVGKVSSLMNPLTYLILNLALAALLWSGALKVQSGILTQGQVIALVNYLSQILVELIKLANLIITMTKALACVGRIDGVLQLPAQQPAHGSPLKTQPAPLLQFSHVSLRYADAGGDALSDISFTLPQGSSLGIIGGTGSGKTSVVNLIPGFYFATEGKVSVDGLDVKDYAPEQLRQRIGLVPQKAALFQGTIRDNLRMGNPAADDETLWQAIEQAQAMDFVSKKGLDFMIEQEGRNLSGGQRQRLTIARALVRHPELLILDDSASALDLATDRKLRIALQQLKNVSTIIVSQRSSSIAHCDQILVLEDGHCVGLGRHEQLLEQCPVYQEIYYSQFPREVKA